MKKIIYVILIMFCLIQYGYSQEEERKFIAQYVGCDKYLSYTGLFDINNNEIKISSNKNTEGNNITKLAIYSIIDKNITPFIFVDGPKIYSGEMVILVDLSLAPKEFYGWSINISRDMYSKKPSGINIQWWANVGNNTTDAIYFIWNKNENRFRINRIDPSNY